MKCMIVGNYFYPATGGVEIYMKNLALELSKRGHRVGILTSNRTFQGNNLRKDGEIENIPIKRISNVLSLFREIMSSDCDIIHFHFYSYRKYLVALGIIAANFTKKRLVFTPHCIYPAGSTILKAIKKAYDLTLGRFILTHVMPLFHLQKMIKAISLELERIQRR